MRETGGKVMAERVEDRGFEGLGVIMSLNASSIRRRVR
jgi:hypothetical protein